MANEWVPIPESKVLQPGDTVRLYYTTVGMTFATAIQIALVEDKLADEPRFEVLSHSYPDESKKQQEFFFTIRITDPATRRERPLEIQEAGIVTVTVCSAIILGALGVVIWISFAGARQLIEEAGEAAEGIEKLGATSVQIAAAAIAVYLIYKYA